MTEPTAIPDAVREALKTVRALCERYQIGALEEFLESCQSFAQEKILNIAVLGRFKAGKSSFLNHLLGKALLPVGVIPVTTVVTEIQYGPEERAQVRFLDGRTESTELGRIGDFISESENPENQKQVASCGWNCHPWSDTGESGSSTPRAWRASSSTTRMRPWNGCRTWAWLWWLSASIRRSRGTTSN